jgi:hypothetical protein
MLETHNLLDVLDLLVLHDLVVSRFTNIEQLSTEREHSEVVTPNHAQTSDGE